MWRVCPTLLIFSCMAILNFAIGNTAEVKLVGTNDRITLTCNFGKVTNKMRWYFRRNLEREEHFVYDLNLKTMPGYIPDCSLEGQYCNITIINATKEKAGEYSFEHGLNGKDGETVCKYRVVVGDLECRSNARKNQLLIGQTDCSIKPETIKRLCSFKYHGNFDGPLNFAWMKREKPRTVIRDKVLSATDVDHQGGVNVLNVEDEIEVTNDMDEATFECYLEGEHYIQPCELSKIHVQYVKNVTSPIIISDDHDNISCSVIKSESVQCFHHWLIQSEGNVEFQVHSPVLTENHLVADGRYTCLSDCHFVTGIVCHVRGTHFDWERTKDHTLVIAMSCLAVTVFLVITALAVALLRIKREQFRNCSTRKSSPHKDNKFPNLVEAERNLVGSDQEGCNS